MFTAFEFEYLDSYFHFDQVEPDSLSHASMEPTQVSAKKAELHVPLCGCDSGVPGYLSLHPGNKSNQVVLNFVFKVTWGIQVSQAMLDICLGRER